MSEPIDEEGWYLAGEQYIRNEAAPIIDELIDAVNELDHRGDYRDTVERARRWLDDNPATDKPN